MKVLDHLEEWIITVLMGMATLVIFIAVVHRYASGLPIPGVQDWLVSLHVSFAQELCIYMVIWMAKFGAAYGVRTGIHVGVDVLINRLPPAWRRKGVLLGLAGGVLFTGIVGTLGAYFVWEMAHTQQVSADLGVPMWLVFLAVPLGSYLMCFRFLQVSWRFTHGGELPRHEPAQVEGLGAMLPMPGQTMSAQTPPWNVPMPPARAAKWLIGLGTALLAIALMGNVGIIFALLIALMLTGMPVSISLGLTVLTFLFFMTKVPIESVALKLFTGIEKFEIMAIPFFVLAGNFLTHGGVARRMINFATSIVGHWHGGLALAGVMACALFAAVSGSSPATVVAIGSIILPAMVNQGFPKRFGAGVITTSGALGILIPPSIVMVIYAVATNTSVGALFMAGVIPGLVLATMLGAVTWYRAWQHGYPRMPTATCAERWRAFRQSVWGLLLILIVMGGIYSGLFTPTEAAAVSAVYAFVVAVFVYKDMPLKRVPKILLDSANMSAMLLYIITNAVLFSFLMTHENIPQAMADWIIAKELGIVLFLLFVNVLLLLAGNVMEPSSIVLILAPILFPVAVKLGINPIHFGILITVNMEIGLCHPPVGLNLYVASGITKMGITELTVAVLPWLFTMLVFLAIVTYWPALSLWLPKALGMI
jgi:C4-dicarboxylate transporter DctM subunit